MIDDILTERGADYGPYDRECMARELMYRAILIQAGGMLEPRHIPLLDVCLKLCREANKHKPDNIDDIIGYLTAAKRSGLFE